LLNEIKSLVEGGFLNAVSVGFVVKNIEEPTQAQREALNMPPFGLLISEAELLETSIVPIPANSEALRLAIDDGLITSKAADHLNVKESNTSDRVVAVELLEAP